MDIEYVKALELYILGHILILKNPLYIDQRLLEVKDQIE